MPLSGTLRTWHDDRGYGFIAPKDGGRELFVHISAFPRDGSRPTIGETLTYELGKGKDGKPQAVRVYRQALGQLAEYSKPRGGRTNQRSPAAAIIGLLVVAGLSAYGYKAYQQRVAHPLLQTTSTQATPAVSPQEINASLHCDGRTHCSQMTSCTEAKFFLKNCPGTQMDGNNDGIPCQQQWCTSPFSK